MKDKNKTLLNEGTVRRFMALAGVESLVNPFLKKVNEEAKLQTEIEANLGAASDAKMGGALPPPTAPEEEPAAPLEEEETLDEYGGGPGGAPDIGGKAPEGQTPAGEAPEGGQPTMQEALTSRTLAESILRHIPNLEIINDKPSLKTQRQSDILSEVTKRVKQLLSK